MKYVDIFESCDLSCDECKYRVSNVTTDSDGDLDYIRTCKKTGLDIPKDTVILKECPIKPLPQKRPCNYYNFEGYNNGYDKGWNDCIDHLTGDGTVK